MLPNVVLLRQCISWHLLYREGKIETPLVYSILLRSGLPHEVLGHIWNLCNRKTPGQLQAQELFMMLGLVTVAQVCVHVCTCVCADFVNSAQNFLGGDGLHIMGHIMFFFPYPYCYRII